MLLCGIGAKPVAHLVQYHLLQWEVAKVKQLMTSNMTLTVLYLHQKTPKGATTKIQVKENFMTPKSVMLGYRGNNDIILNHVFNLAKYYIFVTKCRERTLNFELFKRKISLT